MRLNNENNFIPGLPLGIIKLLESTKEDLKNKEALIISKSDVFYKPLKKLLEDKKIKVKQICINCVMDTTAPKIIFDEKGVCEYCNNYYKKILPNWHPNEKAHEIIANDLISQLC